MVVISRDFHSSVSSQSVGWVAAAAKAAAAVLTDAVAVKKILLSQGPAGMRRSRAQGDEVVRR